MTSTDTGEPVAWRYLSKAKNAKWTVQKNKPVHSFVADCEVEPLYPASALTAQEDEIKRLRKLVSDIDWWSRQKCPCKDEMPDPCPLCGARVDGVGEAGVCKAGTRLPYDLATRVVLARATLDAPKGDANG